MSDDKACCRGTYLIKIVLAAFRLFVLNFLRAILISRTTSVVSVDVKELISSHISSPECVIDKSGAKVCSSVEDLAEAARLAARELHEEMYVRACSDASAQCKSLAVSGQCKDNPEYMLIHCRYSCGVCKDPHDPYARYDSLTDEQIEEAKKAAKSKKEIQMDATSQESPEQYSDDTGEAKDTKQLQHRAIQAKKRDLERLRAQSKLCGVEQKIPNEDERTEKIVREMIAYMETQVSDDTAGADGQMPPGGKTAQKCENSNGQCAFWASLGECDNNAGYMITTCSAACKACHLLNLEERCPERNGTVNPALMHGELNTMFERIVDYHEEKDTWYSSPVVHSRPKKKSYEKKAYGSLLLNKLIKRRKKNDDVSIDTTDKPWLITLDGFLSESECDYLVEAGYKSDYKPTGDRYDRTYEEAWCSDLTGCTKHPLVYRISDKISKLTSLPAQNHEYLQLLKYEEGQYYHRHQDFIQEQVRGESGARVLTLLLYATDVDNGGETHFADLGVKIAPKKGRAVLWSNVLDRNHSKIDSRVHHETKPVLKGQLVAVYAWLHLYDYKTPHKNGCA